MRVMPLGLSDTRSTRLLRIAEANLDVAWRVARRSGVAEAELDDVVQEVFIVVCRRLAEIPKDRERAFVAGTTLRIAANFRRAESRRRWDPFADVDALAESGEQGTRECAQGSSMTRQQGLQSLDCALACMTVPQREVFVLTELEQMTAREVAAQLGIEEPAVVSRLRRAREVFFAYCEQHRNAGELIEPTETARAGVTYGA
jgi:RNA polymerase sigma-70 factor (ECF subfamily)